MSAIAIGGHGHPHSHAIQPSPAFRAHRREDKGSVATEGSATIGKPGQLPAGSGLALLGSAVQSLQQSVGNRVNGAPAQIGGSLNVTA